MLSIFPSLYTYILVAPLLIRIALAVAFGWIGYTETKSSALRILGSIEIILALFILVGLFTQLIALFIAIILAVRLADKIKRGVFFSDDGKYHFVLLAMAVSLMFSGAGFLAFDLPL